MSNARSVGGTMGGEFEAPISHTTHTRTHAHTHTRTHAHSHMVVLARLHTHAHALSLMHMCLAGKGTHPLKMRYTFV